jgi:predicted CXXCH cytochrome family protein
MKREAAAMGRFSTTLLLAMVCLFFSFAGPALGQPHDETNNIGCLDCHALDSEAPWGIVTPRGYEQAALCKSCHNPTGQASSVTEVALHEVDGGMRIVDCGSCHDPHGSSETTDPHTGQTSLNLLLIRDNTDRYVPEAEVPAIFQIRPDTLERTYAYQSAPYTGICQTCHTNTSYHTNDGVDPHHNSDTACTTCHLHKNGFTAGGCTDCHAVPQAARRQIVDTGGDFAEASHHVLGEVQEDDCTVCHFVNSHRSGIVKLKDPDQGDALVYDYNPGAPEELEPFCLGCHDADGATSLADATRPFSDVQIPPNVEGLAGSLWADSAHKVLGFPSNGDNPLTCMGDGATMGCHGNAHGSSNPKILSDDQGTQSIDQFCYNCHTEGVLTNHALADNRTGGYVSADDIEQAFAKPTRHDLGTGFSVGGNDYILQCTTCHNPHVVTGQYWEADLGVSPITRPDLSANPVTNPRAMGTTLWGAASGEKMDDFAARASGSGGWYYSTARGGNISIDQPAFYQPPKDGGGTNAEFSGDIVPDYTTLCLDCHSHRMSDANPPVNWGQGIGCTDNSVDPPNQRIECGAQHGLRMAGKPQYVSDSGTAGFWGSSGNPDALFQMNYVTRGRHNGHFMRRPYDSAERSAGINFVLSCTDCHEAHGSNRGGMIRERFSVNANGDCGTGVNANPDGENCTDGGNWNSFCNACHYYYGGQHAGMSCGNASCHEANSIHRIIHTVDSGAGTQLMLTAAGYESSYQPPDFTPEIESVTGHIGSDQLTVTFRPGQGSYGIYTNEDLSGALTADDFWLFDANNDNPKSISSLSHFAGETTATITLDTALTVADIGADTLAARPLAIWDWYQGGYVNAATGTIPAGAVSAGPWPAIVDGPPPFDLQGVLYGSAQLRLNGIIDDSDQIYVAFAEEAYSITGGDLQVGDFVLDCGGRTISSVAHTAGDSLAVLTLDTVISQSEVGVCTVAAASGAIFDSYGNPAGTAAVTLALPPEASVDELALRWDFDEGAGTVANSSGALGTQEDMHGVLTRNVQWVASTKPGAAAGDNAVELDRVSDSGAVQLNYTINPDDGFPPATYRNGGAPVIVQEMQEAGEFSFSVWIKPTALGCQEGKDLGLNNWLRRDVLTTQFWIKNWALGIMRFSDDGDPITGACTDEESTHDVLRFWVAVGDPTDMRCDPWGGSWPETVYPVSPAGYIQGTWLAPTDQAVCDNSATPTLPTNPKSHSFAQTETSASGAPTYGGVSLQPGVWQHVVGTWDGRYIRIYIDSQLAAETDMGGTGDYVMLADPHLWGGDLIGDGSIFRHVSSFFAAGARPKFSTSGSPSGGAVYWNANGFYDLNS